MSERFEDRFPANAETLRRTPWTLISAAQKGEAGAAGRAVERIYAMFEGPVQGYLRGRGLGVEEAKDLSQEFFAALLERNFLERLDPSKGRLRPFLFASLRRFLCDAIDKRDARKRRPEGGWVPLEGRDGDSRSAAPDRQLSRLWAAEVLRRALEGMKRRCEGTPREPWYRALVLWHQVASAPSQEELGRRLGATPQQVANYLFRGRALLRELLLEEFSAYCASAAEVEAEVAELFDALRGDVR